MNADDTNLHQMIKNAQERHDTLTSPLSSEKGLSFLVMQLNADMLTLLTLLSKSNPPGAHR